jgi:hypothetical protein
MKSIASVAPFVAALAVLSSATVLSQTQGEKPGAAGPTLQQAETKPAATKVKRSRASADARHCLQLATNLEIIRCAEKYR